MKALHVPGAEVDNTDNDGNESDLNIVDNDGNTAFHLACLNGHFTVVDYLCSCGADLEAWYISIYSLLVVSQLSILVKGRMEHH